MYEIYLSVGDLAHRIGNGVRATDITNLFYWGLLRDDLCPVTAGRRLIPESYIPMIEMALRRAGKMTKEVEMGCIPDSYRPARWRNTIPGRGTGFIGIGFTVGDGSILQLSIPSESARHLAETIQESLPGCFPFGKIF